MSLKPTVFISSPYSADPEKYVQEHIKMSHALMDKGFVPVSFVIQTHYMNLYKEREYTEWMLNAMAVMLQCDHVLTLGGNSPGKTQELHVANWNNMLVFDTIEKLIAYYTVYTK